MSWLATNWIGVVALFCAPAMAGIFGWRAALNAQRDADRSARERERQRHMPLSLSRETSHR